jgi:hypothetical protein
MHSAIVLISFLIDRKLLVLDALRHRLETHKNEIRSGFKTRNTFAYAMARRNRKPVEIIETIPPAVARDLDMR